MGEKELGNGAPSRELVGAVEAALTERGGAGRSPPAQRSGRNREPGAEACAHPLEYDGNGFPTPQRIASFHVRVSRLLRGA
jgi:hypothetical protein